MPKNLTVTLSDMEYEILKQIKVVEGEDGDKLRNLLRLYISTIPGLKSSEYALKRVENKEEIDSLLRDVWAAYELTDNPTETWKEDKIDKLTSDLVEINVLVKTGEKQFIPTSKFRNLYKMLLHDIATESKEMDEYSAACIATIQLLKEFSGGTLEKETIRDGTILLNEGWLFAYATAMKKAREFMRTKKLFPEPEEAAAEIS
ncbi:hypothetical protein [Candidatus Methanoperedens nitratireducens]|uniref:Uncharacterized protein n=1 Tax=Candidatus Methanoperedens nitratireducens TaxID=1392998 RepID=A0A284VM79_9EURY|nr:hypothetical protein [Candidatus Methanoperedens nitroreducens]SNQ60313.1 hypothetical protein MNV_1740058 [Candidatus Methanoperedens nitroreducens]